MSSAATGLWFLHPPGALGMMTVCRVVGDGDRSACGRGPRPMPRKSSTRSDYGRSATQFSTTNITHLRIVFGRDAAPGGGLGGWEVGMRAVAAGKSGAHLRFTRMARPSVSKEIMCDPVGETAMHSISVRFSLGRVVLEERWRSTSVTRLPTLVRGGCP